MLKILRDENGNHFTDDKPFCPEDYTKVGLYQKKTLTKAGRMEETFSIETLEGTMEGRVGDWLMIGINGEMYPCDADIFEKTYEAAALESE